jgi:hypothetical protein
MIPHYRWGILARLEGRKISDKIAGKRDLVDHIILNFCSRHPKEVLTGKNHLHQSFFRLIWPLTNIAGDEHRALLRGSQ